MRKLVKKHGNQWEKLGHHVLMSADHCAVPIVGLYHSAISRDLDKVRLFLCKSLKGVNYQLSSILYKVGIFVYFS